MSGKLNVDGRVSIIVVINSKVPLGMDSMIRQDYADLDYVFVDDSDGMVESIEMSILAHPMVEDMRPNIKLIGTIGPSEYTPNGWQLPYILGLSESTGEYLFLCSPKEPIPLDTVSILMNVIGEAPMATFTQISNYNESLMSAVQHNTQFTSWLEGPVLLRKDVYFRRASQIVGQFHYMRFLQLRMWLEGDIARAWTGHEYFPVEDVSQEDIRVELLACGYLEGDISSGGKYNYELNDYELRDLSVDLRERAGVDGEGVLTLTLDINYA